MQFDNLIIGGNLSSVIYSYLHKIPLIYIKEQQQIPFPFEHYDPSLDFSFLFLKNEENKKICNDDKEIIWGIPKKNVYERLIFSLSMAGLVPFVDMVKKIEIQDDSIRVSLNNKIINANFKRLYLFESEGVEGLPKIAKIDKNPLYEVVDWFDVRTGTEHRFDIIKTNDLFIQYCFFHPSSRRGLIGFKNIRKDVVSYSNLNEKQIREFDYSEHMARMKVQVLMKEIGIKVSPNGKDRKGRQRYLNPAVEHQKREIRKKSRHTYEKCDNINYMFNINEQDLIREFCNFEDESYVRKINEMLSHVH